MVELKTVANEKRCLWTQETHVLEISDCCPISHNPLSGSTIEIVYDPDGTILEVAALRAYVNSFRGGRGGIRSMEGMIQSIAQDCADTVRTYVRVNAHLLIDPAQQMKLKCAASPSR
jgi:7-cyano-7-deazaguanine reductase